MVKDTHIEKLRRQAEQAKARLKAAEQRLAAKQRKNDTRLKILFGSVVVSDQNLMKDLFHKLSERDQEWIRSNFPDIVKTQEQYE